MTLPVTLTEAKEQLQLAPDDDGRDAEIFGFIADAAGWVEQYTGHVLEQREVAEQFAGFGAVRLRCWPIATPAAVNVAYDAGAGSTQIDGARLDVSRRPARVLPAFGTSWPRVGLDAAVTVTVTAGYASPTDVPRNLRRAMLVLIAGYDADREGGEVFAKAEAAARLLCDRLRLRRL